MNQFSIDLSIAILSDEHMIVDSVVGDHVEDLLAGTITKFLANHSKHKLGPSTDFPVCRDCNKPLSRWKPWDFCVAGKVISAEVKGEVIEHHFRCRHGHEFSVLVKSEHLIVADIRSDDTLQDCMVRDCYQPIVLMGSNPSEVSKNISESIST